MEFKVQKYDLLDELKLIQSVVETKTTIPILANVLLKTTGEGLGVVGTDLEVGIKSRCKAEVKEEGAITLPAKRLFEIIRLCPDKEMRFKTDPQLRTVITCGKGRWQVAGLPDEDFPVLPGPDKEANQIELPAATLNTMITRTIYCISTEDTKFTFSGALLIINPKNLTMIATDGHRLACVRRDTDVDIEEEVKLLIPKKAMSELQQLLPEAGQTVRLSRDETHLFFNLGSRLLVSRVLSGQFPNWETVMPKDNEAAFTVNRAQMGAVIRRVAILADERSRCIAIEVNGDGLALTAQKADTGDARETMEVQHSMPEGFQVGVNHQYLTDFLSSITEDSVEFRVKDPEHALLLKALSPEGASDEYVVMPMRI